MNKKIIISFFAVLALFSFQNESQKGLEVGETFDNPNFALQTMKGKETTLMANMGQKGLVVVFSCNTCPFVVGNQEFAGWEKQYNSLYQMAKAKGLNLVLVNSNEAKRTNDDSPEEMKKHAKKMKYKMPYLIDSNSKFANALGAKTTPHVYVFSADYKLIYKGSIDNSWDSKRTEELDYLKLTLENIAKNETVNISESSPKGCSIKRIL